MYARAPRGIQLGLDRVRDACIANGGVHASIPVLHIGGTNGKGSAAAMAADAARRSGYRTGLFTSPHLCRFAERVQIDGAPIDDELLARSLDTALAFEPALSFFEVTFLAAMLAFREARVDVAVLEVGLGGRFDATNVCESVIATAVTRVALDHTDILGDTIEKIAFEKASIAKPACPMILGRTGNDAERALRSVAVQAGAVPVLGIGRELALDGDMLDLPSGWGRMRLCPGLLGRHQVDNAAVAASLCAVASEVFERLTPAATQAAISKARWPARLERIEHEGRVVLLDAAHNVDGMGSLVSYLNEESARGRHEPRRAALVFGAMANKAWAGMLASIATQADHRFYVAPSGRAPAPVGAMPDVAQGEATGGVAEALARAVSATPEGGLIVVCGSIFLAAEARALILGLERDPAVAL